MRRLWLAFAVVLLFSFAVLGWVGTRIYQQAPPLPDQVVTTDGKVVIPSGEIEKGQNVWQAMGGMEVGSIWGRGSYVAPVPRQPPHDAIPQFVAQSMFDSRAAIRRLPE